MEECSSTLATTYSSGTPGQDASIVTVDQVHDVDDHGNYDDDDDDDDCDDGDKCQSVDSWGQKHNHDDDDCNGS